jgi:hypothetical protein
MGKFVKTVNMDLTVCRHNLYRCEVHIMFIAEKTLSTEALLPGKHRDISTNLCSCKEGTIFSEKCKNTSLHLAQVLALFMSHSFIFYFVTNVFNKDILLNRLSSSMAITSTLAEKKCTVSTIFTLCGTVFKSVHSA